MSDTIKAIIVDDEPHGQENIEILLSDYFPQIQVIDKASNAFEARTLINKLKPHLVFLDVNMSKASGIELLESFEERKFQTIMVTAYQEHTLKALKLGVVGYLLKPIIHEEFEQVVNHAIKNIEAFLPETKNDREEIKNQETTHQLVIKHAKGFDLVAYDDIIRIEALGNYSRILLQSGQILTISKTLKWFDPQLNPEVFLRIHKTHIVNIRYIQGYENVNNGEIILKDSTRLKVAILRKAEIRKKIMEFLENKVI